MDNERFPCMQLDKPVPLITTVTTRWRVQIVQLQKSRPHQQLNRV